jgi:hypothetical protein
MEFTVAIGAEQLALFEFAFDLLKGGCPDVRQGEVLLAGIAVMKFQGAFAAIVAARLATASLVGDRLRLDLSLARYRLLDGARLAVDSHANATTPSVELLERQFLPTGRAWFPHAPILSLLWPGVVDKSNKCSKLKLVTLLSQRGVQRPAFVMSPGSIQKIRPKPPM